MSVDRDILIDLDLPRMAGFRRFISSWVVQRNGVTLLVDPGPLSTIPHLLGELRRHDIGQIDHVLLTHIHIDHAGGTGALLAEFPEARVLCHPDGIRHLVSPDKLWEGSRKVLGTLAEIYGEIVPVPEDRIGFCREIPAANVTVHETPGHAPHHLSFLIGDLLFAGEVAGVRCDLAEGIFMRPATPPRFNLDIALSSLDRVTALAPRRMAFAHYGLVDDAEKYLRIARQQLSLWVRGISLWCREGENRRNEVLIQWLRDNDPYYRTVALLPADIQEREAYFLGNTVKGMEEYVMSLSDEDRSRINEASA